MIMSPSIFLVRSRPFFPFPSPSNLHLSRRMGGGPRTFPGGLSKWKYRRMHEKLAREKERNLLNQEKELYQARIRTAIRAQLTAFPTSGNPNAPPRSYGPVTPSQQVKALADRFVKRCAEDLWNDEDGPLLSKAPPPSPPPPNDDGTPLLSKAPAPSPPLPPSSSRPPPLDPRNGNGSGSWRNVESFYHQRREYSAMARRAQGQRHCFHQDSDSDSGYSFEKDNFPKFKSGSKEGLPDEQEASESGDEMGPRRKMMMTGAALGNYDRKKTKKVSIDLLERLSSQQVVQDIQEQFNERQSVVERAVQRDHNNDSVFTQKRFDECDISPLTIKALTSAGFEKMTMVQAAALPGCLDGKDVLVKAIAGTGKSAAFLLATIEAVLKAKSISENRRVPVPPILALILCPTRELASQVAAEANVLLMHHSGVNVQTLIGGTRFKVDQKLLETNPPQILVATPGRLLDHIENKARFSLRLMGLKVLVVDEVDHLLGLGFRGDIEKIIDCVPRQRQSLLFSATIPKEVRRISQLVLNKDHVYIDTVGLSGLETHDKITQSYIVAPHEDHFEVIYHLLKEHISQEIEYKVIVFCTTAMVTSLVYMFLRNMRMNAREIHSRKPQSYRTRICDEFRESKRLILVTSDVSARGVDYPDVTLIVQMGIPCDREHYIHRIGRTGRKGKDGAGILLLAPWEEYFLNEIKDFPIRKSQIPELDTEVKPKIEASLQNIDTGTKEAAYHAWLGYYNSISEIGRDKTTLADLANKFCLSIGLRKSPPLFRKTALKMGLKGVSGIKIQR